MIVASNFVFITLTPFSVVLEVRPHHFLVHFNEL